jgi:hypothetical protein
MPPSIPTSPPDKIVRNSQVSWTVSLSDFTPATDTLAITLIGTGDQVEVTATTSGTLFLVTLTAAITGALDAGDYLLQARVTSGGVVYQLNGQQGLPQLNHRLQVVRDAAEHSSGYDLRSHAQIVLDALEATIAGKATKDQSAYTIGNRSMSHLAPDELLRWRDYYARLVGNEVAAERREQGKGSRSKKKVRFV